MPRTPKSPALPSVPFESLESIIHPIRGERVILDADLAKLYGVETRVLKQAVRRHLAKFPSDFMFELTRAEASHLQRALNPKDVILRSQIVTLRHGRHIKHLPFAFTEHGALMAATILNSPQSLQMSVFIIRAFIRMRSLLTDTRELATKLASLEQELTARLDTHEVAITDFMSRLLQLLDPPPASPPPPDKELGFHTTLKPRPRP